MKLCKDCKHWEKPGLMAEDGYCHHQNNKVIEQPSLIDGTSRGTVYVHEPYNLRYTSDPLLCGEIGQWWESKDA